MVFSGRRPPPPPPPPPVVTHRVNHEYIPLYTFTQGRGEGGRWTSEKVKGALVHKRGQTYQHDWLYLQSINSIKPSVQTTFRIWYLYRYLVHGCKQTTSKNWLLTRGHHARYYHQTIGNRPLAAATHSHAIPFSDWLQPVPNNFGKFWSPEKVFAQNQLFNISGAALNFGGKGFRYMYIFSTNLKTWISRSVIDKILLLSKEKPWLFVRYTFCREGHYLWIYSWMLFSHSRS